MESRNPMRVSWPVSLTVAALFVWSLWTGLQVWRSMGPLFGPVDPAQARFVGHTPVVGLFGLVVLGVFGAALLALAGELGSDEVTVSLSGE